MHYIENFLITMHFCVLKVASALEFCLCSVECAHVVVGYLYAVECF